MHKTKEGKLVFILETESVIDHRNLSSCCEPISVVTMSMYGENLNIVSTMIVRVCKN
jgi:hypothetical protein